MHNSSFIEAGLKNMIFSIIIFINSSEQLQVLKQ
jgi:hypothetical protein